MRIFLIVLAVAVIALGVGYLVFRDDAVDNSPLPSVSLSPSPTLRPAGSAAPAPTAQAWVVRFTAQGPVPKTLTIRAGDSVSLINDTSVEIWPASNPHPTHNQCPGFDAKRGLRQGEGYSLTFATKRTCGYHSHLDPSNAAQQGTIVVQ